MREEVQDRPAVPSLHREEAFHREDQEEALEETQEVTIEGATEETQEEVTEEEREDLDVNPPQEEIKNENIDFLQHSKDANTHISG